ncbi:MAG: hypothetical protein SFY68_02415, partial [Candidatus Sumerlaeia bacterium]|nr:hypothetical protein [Candidatus Sumerlaeia bacterium]
PEPTSTPAPTPTPEPTPTPLPEPTAVPVLQPTPTPLPTVPPTPVPTAPPAPSPTPRESAPDGPKVATMLRIPAEKPIDSLSMKTAMNKRFSDLINTQIENPSFYGRFTAQENALVRMGGATSEYLIQRLRDAAKTHTKIDLSFRITEESRHWENYAVLMVEPTIRAHPNGHANRNFREVIYVAPQPVNLVFERAERNEWRFVCIDCK